MEGSKGRRQIQKNRKEKGMGKRKHEEEMNTQVRKADERKRNKSMEKVRGDDGKVT